jgi:hypothetical protein
MRWLIVLLAFIVFESNAFASDDPPTEFSKQVTAITGDWEAEDWRKGVLVLHPKQYTWQSDHFLNLLAEEPVAGRIAMDAAKSHWEGDSLGDDTTDPTLIRMADAKEVTPGILAVNYRWNYAFDTNVSLYGVVTTAANTYVPFHSNCETDDPKFPKEYPLEKCIHMVLGLLMAVRDGGPNPGQRLTLPDTAAPLNIAGWDGQYLADGTSLATNGSQNGLRKVLLYVSPPRMVAPDQLAPALKRFSDAIIHDDDDADENPGSVKIVGTNNDPWIRREFPAAFEGPSIQMTGTAPTPDGKTVFIGIRCPNSGWLKTCAYGVEQAKLQVKTGQLEARRQKIIAATQIPLPTNGLKDAQIAGIYTEGRNTMGAGGFMTGYEIDGTVLLKNGRALNDLDLPPAYIDPVAAAQKDPDEWGHWTRTGDTINIRWDDGDTDTIKVTGDNLMIGGTKGMQLSGKYRHVSGGGSIAFGGGNSFLSESSYTFFPNGTFDSDRSSSFMVGPGAGGEGGSAMGGSGGGGPNGRYLVDGYTLVLTYPDGRISRLSFAGYAQDMTKLDRDLLMLNGTVYFRDDGK